MKGAPPSEEPEKARRKTVFNVASGEVTTGPPTRGSTHPRRHTAVAAVLGAPLHEQVRRSETTNVDVEILLKGAEKLCGVYELPGAKDRIAALRGKYRNGNNTMAYYEAKVAEQSTALEGLNKDWMADEDEDEDEDDRGLGDDVWTLEDLRREEEGVREMEAKKRELQARLRQMEKDLGDLRRM